MKARFHLHAILALAVLFSLFPQPARAATYCDSIQFVADVTVPDGTTFDPGVTFTKTWRLMNNGSCAWSTAYALVYESGDRFGASTPVNFSSEVPPGQMVDISLTMQAPSVAGHYRGYFKLMNAAGALFGIGSSANHAFWVDINVINASSGIYNFATNASYARWLSGQGPLAFPGTSGDSRGYALPVNLPRLEDGTTASEPGLLTYPESKYGGYLQAAYPEMLVQSGDRFQALVNCEYGATSCYVTFRVDYVVAGVRRILWTWKEKYDGRYFRADLDLSFLAGKKVQFILMTLATGFADGDRALWVAPHIARNSGNVSPPPTFTPTITPYAAPPTFAAPGCNKGTFVADVTVPKGMIFSPSASFVKIWRLKNIGLCTWTTAYTLVFYSGDQMGGPTAVNLPKTVYSGQTVDVSVNMTAPPAAGTYRGNWVLRDASGNPFFGGSDAGFDTLWLEIQVAGNPPAGAGYDFAANVCSARWVSGAGALPCPGTDGDSRGAVIRLDAPQLETGAAGTSPALLTLPQNKTDGYIQGIYPAFTVQPGDHFKADVGCAYGAANCYVTFRLDYLTPGGATKVFWRWKEKYEGKVYSADVDLSKLAGQSVRFILTILATGSPKGDRALWSAPRIVNTASPAPTWTPTPIPTAIVIPGVLVPAPTIRALDMLDAVNGWAAGDNYILHTADGGQTWYNVLDIASSGSFFLNASTGWVMEASSTLYRTTNGGAAWAQYQVPFNSGILQFLDGGNGFLMTGGPIGMFKYPISLYQTTDGGANWTLKFTHNPPGVGSGLELSGYKYGITFRDTSNGWIGGGNDPAEQFFYLFRTSNGGVNWVHLQPAYPAGYEAAFMDTTAPQFFGANDGLLPVWMTIGAEMRDLFLYVTHDGGNTWAPSAGYARNVVWVDIISKTDAVSWDNAGNLYMTHNAGGSWTTLTPNVNFGPGSRSVDFVSPSTGWLVLAPMNGSTPLYRTLDGGVTWTLLSGQLLLPTATPTSTPTETTAPTPTSTPTATTTSQPPAAAIGPYAVWRVAFNDVLNIRSDAGISNPIVGSFPPTATNVMRTGTAAQADGATWWEVQRPDGGLGWVNASYLTEYVTRDAFCADGRILPLIEQLRQSVGQSSGGLLSPLVSPLRGLDVYYWSSQLGAAYTPAQALNIYQDGSSYNWGAGPSGQPDVGTFSNVVYPQLSAALGAASLQLLCDDDSKTGPAIDRFPVIYNGANFYALYKPGTPGVELDYITWLAGFEYINGQPSLFALMRFVWEP